MDQKLIEQYAHSGKERANNPQFKGNQQVKLQLDDNIKNKTKKLEELQRN